jgi:hypothetical protein
MSEPIPSPGAVQARRVTSTDLSDNIPLQIQNEHEFLCIIQGEAILRIDDDTYEVSAGDLFFIQSGSLLTLSNPSADLVYDRIIVDLRAVIGSNEHMRTYCDHLEDRTWVVHAFLGHNPPIFRELFERLFRTAASAQNPGSELELYGLVLQFMGRLLQDGRWDSSEQLPENDARAQNVVRRVLALIEDRYAQDLTLADMAAAANLSPNYFCRYFKKLAGCSPVNISLIIASIWLLIC